jgi:hypothetical protein
MPKDRKKFYDKSLSLFKRRSTINLIIVAIAFAIALASVYYTRIIVEQLKDRELGIIELYAKSLEETINNSNSHDELSFLVREILYPNNSIPIILTNGIDQIQSTKNVDVDPLLNDEQRELYLKSELEKMKLEYPPIEIPFGMKKEKFTTINIFTIQTPALLIKLQYYPHIQLSVIALYRNYSIHSV